MTEDTQQAIAEDLGVSRETVRRAVNELERSGKLTQVCELNTDEKREQVREFVEDTPDNPGTRRPVFTGSFPAIVSDIQRGVWALGSRAPSGDSPRIPPHISAGPYNRPRAVKQSKIQAGHNSPRTRRGVATR